MWYCQQHSFLNIKVGKYLSTCYCVPLLVEVIKCPQWLTGHPQYRPLLSRKLCEMIFEHWEHCTSSVLLVYTRPEAVPHLFPSVSSGLSRSPEVLGFTFYLKNTHFVPPCFWSISKTKGNKLLARLIYSVNKLFFLRQLYYKMSFLFFNRKLKNYWEMS